MIVIVHMQVMLFKNNKKEMVFACFTTVLSWSVQYGSNFTRITGHNAVT